MKVTGIVVEYNPMHNGHLKHINLCKKNAGSEVIVAVMSGNFVQRGEPALLDKWTRTKCALNNGVDLVIELPTVYSLSSAEFFAFGAVGILNSLGIIDNICFGSENPDIDKMLTIAHVLVKEPELYKKQLKQYIDMGNNFSSARNLALNKYLKEDLSYFINNSNNILGIEYCKSLIKLKSNIIPIPVKRDGSSYNEEVLSNLSSATSIRKYIKSSKDIKELENHLPKDVFIELKKLKDSNNITDVENLMPFIKYKCYTGKNPFANIPDASEGLENRIFNSLQNNESFYNVIMDIKTKRYAYSRISRILCQFFLGFGEYNTIELRKSQPSYGRILGFNNKGAELLRKAAKTSSIPLITKVKKGKYQALDLDIQATNAYSLLNNDIIYNQDFYTGPVIL